MGLKIACVGEAMIEFSATDAEQRLAVSGDALNTAVYLRRALTSEHQVAFVSTVGIDPLSDQIERFVIAENIIPRLQRHDSRLPGLYAIKTDRNGERSFFFWRENSAARTMFSDGLDVLDGFDVIHITAIALAILPTDIRQQLLNWLADWPGTVSFDSNYRPNLWPDQNAARSAVATAFEICDIALPSLDDELALFGDADQSAVLNRLRDHGIRRGALKRGVHGPVPIAENFDSALQYPQATRIVDTTAAGDSFNGCYLARLLSDASEQDAMMAGHLCALHVIAQKGAIVPAN